MSNFIRYVGYSDKPSQDQIAQFPAWAVIEDSPEAIEEALRNGYTAVSTMAFSHPIEKEKETPVRRGNLIIDIDCKDDTLEGIKIAKRFLHKLHRRYGIPPQYIRCWISGGKGCHLELPAALFGGEEGDLYLPLIHKKLLEAILQIANIDTVSSFDSGMYNMGKGKLLRAANIERPNGRYKVPVQAAELLEMPEQDLFDLTRSQRDIQHDDNMQYPQHPWLSRIFNLSKMFIHLSKQNKYPVTSLEAILKCEFIKHCIDDAETLSEPEWFTMIALLLPLGDLGRELIHIFSAPHPEYSYEKTEQKCVSTEQNRQQRLPMTCEHIKGLFPCTQQCAVRSPNDLWAMQKKNEKIIESDYISNENGLFLKDGRDENGQLKLLKICSPIQVLRRTCGIDGSEWGRSVLIKNGFQDITKDISMKDVLKTEFLGELLDAGLQVENVSIAKKYLPLYILNVETEESLTMMTKQLGWYKDAYILPDKVFGENDMNVEFQSSGVKHFHQESNTLDEWKENIGMLCRGNSLLVLTTALALSSPLLTLLSEEGIGLNIYGASSSGKTTCALVAGSVVGGGGRNGYLRTWRSTDNALEAIAAQHNDGLLILDELGQAIGDNVGKIIYMLINGESKSRMTAEVALRKGTQWRINILSTGELTIPEKIRENGRSRAMAGQEVRVIDLPIAGNNNQSLFEDLHGFENGGELSKALSQRSKEYYGSALRCFLSHLCENKEECLDYIQEIIKNFEVDNCPQQSSGQVQRVCRKFAIIAAAGEMAVKMDVFPYSTQESVAAASQWFHIWLEARNGIGDLEMEKCIKRIIENIESSGDCLFANIQSEASWERVKKPHYWGYYWQEGNSTVYFVDSLRFKEWCRGVNVNAVKQELKKRHLLKLNAEGNIQETKSIDGKNRRGVGIVILNVQAPPENEKRQTSVTVVSDMKLFD